MKILFLYANLMNDFNDTFKEFKTGMEFSGCITRLCPKEIRYKDVKGFDVIIFDSPFQLIRKSNGYMPEIIDEDVHKLKLGIYTMDYFGDITRKSEHNWLEKNKVKDFVIFRHSSGIEGFKDPSKFNFEPIRFLYKEHVSVFWNKFDHAFLAPFTISKERMQLADKMQKNFDVCLGANIVPGYPLRSRIKEAVSGKKGLRVIDPGHKGTARVAFTDYYKGVSQSWLSVASTGVGNISVRKHYEICGLGSTCLGNHTELEDHELVALNTITLDNDTKPSIKPDQIFEIIIKVLRDKDKLVEMQQIKYKIREQFDYRTIANKLIQDLTNTFG